MKEKLERRFLAKLEKVNHISENQHYIGYSKLYNRKIFIKVFGDENKFILENEILNDESSLYITSDYLNKILVLSFREYKNLVSSDMENDVLIKISKVISNFHKKKYIDKGKYKETSLKKILEYNLTRLVKREEFDLLSRIYNEFFKLLCSIEGEYKESLVTIHGDFCLRNIKVYNKNIVLIDFERAKYASYYLDFIKFFYNDLNNSKEKKDIFLNEYYRESNKKKISKNLEYCLIFISSMGILNYTMRIKDREFEKLGLTMLTDVKNFLQI